MSNQKLKTAVLIAKISFYLCTPFLLFMLYWSSLIEEDLSLNLGRRIDQLENRLDQFTNRWQLHLTQLMKNNGSTQELSFSKEAKEIKRTTLYPNLLEDDPFYQETLPQLLGKDFEIQGTRKQGFFGKPQNLHPLSNYAEISELWDLSTRWMGRSHVGFYDRVAPSLATRIEARPRKGQEDHSQQTNLREGEFWVFMRNDIYWQPINPKTLPAHLKLHEHFFRPHKVTAWDVKFYLDAILNPQVQIPGAIAQRELYEDVESFEVIDDYTFVVRWKLKKAGEKRAMKYRSFFLVAGLRALPSFVYQYYPDGKKIIDNDSEPDIYRHHSIWAQIFTEHWAQQTIISCGDWVLDELTSNEILFKRNSSAPDPFGALNARLHMNIKDSFENLWQDFKNNELDFYTLRTSQLLEKKRFMQSARYREQARQGHAIKELSYPARAFTYIGWNMKNPLFESAQVRQALSLGIDQDQMIRQHLNGQAIKITGPFHINSPSCDPKVQAYPFDPIQAKKILEENGWKDLNHDGILDKVIDGKITPFSFSLTYYVKNPTARLISEYISDNLRNIGIDCKLHGVDITDFSESLDDKSFDAYISGWSQSTHPENIRQLWHSDSARSKGSSNTVGFCHKRADEIIEQIEYVYDAQERLELYREFHRILHEEQPYTFLYTPITTLVYREHLKNVFLPIERQDLIPGAITAEPNSRLFYVQEPFM